MGRHDIIRLLDERRTDLERFGVKALALFGSVARDEAREDSDVDILVEFTAPATFDRFMELRFFLEDLLGRTIDLVTPKALEPRLRARIESEAVHVPGF